MKLIVHAAFERKAVAVHIKRFLPQICRLQVCSIFLCMDNLKCDIEKIYPNLIRGKSIMDAKGLGNQVLTKGWQMVKSNKGMLMYMGLMMMSSHCLASTSMPWDSGIESLKANLMA